MHLHPPTLNAFLRIFLHFFFLHIFVLIPVWGVDSCVVVAVLNIIEHSLLVFLWSTKVLDSKVFWFWTQSLLCCFATLHCYYTSEWDIMQSTSGQFVWRGGEGGATTGGGATFHGFISINYQPGKSSSCFFHQQHFLLRSCSSPILVNFLCHSMLQHVQTPRHLRTGGERTGAGCLEFGETRYPPAALQLHSVSHSLKIWVASIFFVLYILFIFLFLSANLALHKPLFINIF